MHRILHKPTLRQPVADVSVARVGMIQQRIKKSDERGSVPQYGRTDQSLRSGSTCEAEMAVPSVTRVT